MSGVVLLQRRGWCCIFHDHWTTFFFPLRLSPLALPTMYGSPEIVGMHDSETILRFLHVAGMGPGSGKANGWLQN